MGGGQWSPFYRVPIGLYIKVGKNPSQDVFIQKGDVLVRFYMEQRNNQPGCPLCGYIWDVVADNDAYFATTSCTINEAKQMNVDFGPISGTTSPLA